MSASTALIGSTGLVGSTLERQAPFDLPVHSTNSADLRGGSFSHVVFSAARAEKWRANGDPAGDARHIDDLIDLLGSFRTERLTLISTVDVFPAAVDVDEASIVDVAAQHPYGAGRHRLERAAAALHDHVLVARLPALFGTGLKKNVVYDLLHDNGIERIQPRSSFQYYDLTRLTADLALAWKAELPLVHLVTEPLSTARVVAEAFGRAPLAEPEDAAVVRYDVRTRFAGSFGSAGPYIESAPEVLRRLRAFVVQEDAA